MPTNNHFEEDAFQDAINDYMKDLSFVRPAFDYLKDGNYLVSIHYAGGLKTSNGLMLKVTGLFQDEDGNEIEDSLLIAPDWKPGKPFRKLLELSNCLPGPKEARLGRTAWSDFPVHHQGKQQKWQRLRQPCRCSLTGRRRVNPADYLTTDGGLLPVHKTTTESGERT